MNTNPIALLRQCIPSLYSEYLPADLHIRNANGHEKFVALDAATVDDLAFAIQSLNQQVSTISRQRAALDDLYTTLRQRGARGSDRVVDATKED